MVQQLDLSAENPISTILQMGRATRTVYSSYVDWKTSRLWNAIRFPWRRWVCSRIAWLVHAIPRRSGCCVYHTGAYGTIEIKVLQDKANALFSWYTNPGEKILSAVHANHSMQRDGEDGILSDFKTMEMETTNPEFTVRLISCFQYETRSQQPRQFLIIINTVTSEAIRGESTDFLSSTLNSFLGAQLVERSSVILLFDAAQELHVYHGRGRLGWSCSSSSSTTASSSSSLYDEQ